MKHGGQDIIEAGDDWSRRRKENSSAILAMLSGRSFRHWVMRDPGGDGDGTVIASRERIISSACSGSLMLSQRERLFLWGSQDMHDENLMLLTNRANS